jgi:hypothetical protein
VTSKTIKQYREQTEKARKVFIAKNKDYGTNWRIMRLSTLIDQIFIKATRIRSIEEGKIQKVADDIPSEYIGIINYSILTLIQMEYGEKLPEEVDFNEILSLYEHFISSAMNLMEAKNHDYGEAWRDMYITSYTDLILSKLLRIRAIIENKGKTIASEGIDANLFDIINYSFFGLIKLHENENK